jgi:hypothetical protein
MTSSSRDNIIQRMFNFFAKELEQVILERVLIDAPPLDEIIYKLAERLGINKVEAVGLLGISSAQEISKATLTVEILDRADVTIEMFARVAKILGEVRARLWF